MPNPLRIAAPLAEMADALRDVRDTLPRPLGDAAAPLLVDSRTAAKLLAVSERTLWEITSIGDLKYVRLGRAKRYTLRDLEEFVEKLRKRSAKV